MEELSFVPSAVSEPRWALHMCNDKCNKEGFWFYQLTAIVTEGGGGNVRTINLCKQCYNDRRLKEGERAVAASSWREIVEQRAFPRKAVGGLWYGATCAKNV